MKTLFALFLCAAALHADKKDRPWIPGTVIAIEHIPGRVMEVNPTSVYVIRTESTDYTLEHSARTYYTKPPRDLVKIGDSVQIEIKGKNAILKTTSAEKKLRIGKSSMRSN
jgi:hypothetical protein